MRRLTYLLVLVLIGTLIVGGLAWAQEATMKTYSNEEYGFKVSYPEGWMKTEIEYQGGAVVSLNAYPDPHSVSVTASKLKKDVDLEEYIQADDLQVMSLAMYQNLKKSKQIISRVTAFIRVASLARSGGGGIRTKEVYMKKGDIIYQLSFHTSIDSYDQAEEDYFSPILESFELI